MIILQIIWDIWMFAMYLVGVNATARFGIDRFKKRSKKKRLEYWTQWFGKVSVNRHGGIGLYDLENVKVVTIDFLDDEFIFVRDDFAWVKDLSGRKKRSFRAWYTDTVMYGINRERELAGVERNSRGS